MLNTCKSFVCLYLNVNIKSITVCQLGSGSQKTFFFIIFKDNAINRLCNAPLFHRSLTKIMWVPCAFVTNHEILLFLLTNKQLEHLTLKPSLQNPNIDIVTVQGNQSGTPFQTVASKDKILEELNASLFISWDINNCH